MDKQNKLFKIIILIGFICLVIIIFSQQIDFTRIDLGRHLENGKIVWQNPQVLFQNFYSYTQPSFVFINHHWLSGVIFYLLYSFGGFKLLIIFNILLALANFLLAFNLAKRKSNFYLSSLTALPAIYLLSERVEIRPEIFSYLLIIVIWTLIDNTSRDQNWRRLLWFIPLFIVWVNLHIYFFLGLTLIGLKICAEFISIFIKSAGNFKNRFKTAWPVIKPWVISLGVSLVACLINPNTWRGLLYPLNIFKNYGYEIAENKSIFYLGHLMLNANFLLFKIIFGTLLVSWGLHFLFSRKLRLFDIFISLLFSALALFASRNLALFALVTLILIPTNFAKPYKYLKNIFFDKFPLVKEKLKIYLFGSFILLIVGSGFYFVIDSSSYNSYIKNPLGFSLSNGNADSIKFFETNNLSGPIFNNYDIGSALIFWLFPREKVFVDNRPEAYSNDFFTKTYIPMQNNPAKWQEISQLYKLKTIYFSYTDGTPWAQLFLQQILNNPDWSLVYFDRSTVILLNKKLNDKSVIEKLSLKEKSFRDRLRSLVDNSNLKGKFYLASLAEYANQPLLAEEVYKGILIKYPDYNSALVSLGSLYSNSAQSADLVKSLKYFEAALNNDYKLPAIYNQIGLVDWKLGEYQKAETAWYSALKLERNNTSALYYLNQIKELRSSGKLPLK